jgi:FAD/FMN-containing dehydrogenase
MSEAEHPGSPSTPRPPGTASQWSVARSANTGFAGLTLSGGMGWLTSQQGVACDNLVAATLVTADGRTVTASDQAHPDVIWALRGAGTNFGVVTKLVFALHEVNPVNRRRDA